MAWPAAPPSTPGERSLRADRSCHHFSIYHPQLLAATADWCRQVSILQGPRNAGWSCQQQQQQQWCKAARRASRWRPRHRDEFTNNWQAIIYLRAQLRVVRIAIAGTIEQLSLEGKHIEQGKHYTTSKEWTAIKTAGRCWSMSKVYQ